MFLCFVRALTIKTVPVLPTKPILNVHHEKEYSAYSSMCEKNKNTKLLERGGDVF